MSKRSNSKRGRGNNFSTANRRLPLSTPSLVKSTRFVQPSLFPDLTETEDRRRWHPLGATAPAAGRSRPRHRLKIPSPVPFTIGQATRHKVSNAITAFSVPSDVAICVRRKRRKEVMFATKKAGKVGQRRPRRSEYSSVSCRG